MFIMRKVVLVQYVFLEYAKKVARRTVSRLEVVLSTERKLFKEKIVKVYGLKDGKHQKQGSSFKTGPDQYQVCEMWEDCVLC